MGSYGDLWRARTQMMRPGNGAMVVAGVLLGAAHTVGWRPMADAYTGGPGLTVWFAAPLAAFLINSFGNVLNDIVDRHIDATAHPERPLPQGRMPLRDAKAFAVLLLGFGLVEAWVAGGAPLLLFAAINAAVLSFYELRLKRMPAIGNLAVAALVASTFAFGSVAAGGHPRDWYALWWIMAMVALVNLAREVLKDIQDMDFDQGRRTLPMAIGAAPAGWVATIAIGIAVGLDASLVWEAHWRPAGRVVLAVAGVGFVVAGGLGCYQARRGQQALKLVMVVALVGLALAP